MYAGYQVMTKDLLGPSIPLFSSFGGREVGRKSGYLIYQWLARRLSVYQPILVFVTRRL